MRRTDEAFKKEVLRRYGVQAKNRRNLRILAISPLIFCVFIAAILWLPSLLNLWIPTPVADTPETTTTTVEDTPPEDTPPEDTPPEDALKLGTLIPEPSVITAMRFRDDRYANTMLTTEDPHDIQMILPLLSEIVVKQVSDSTEMVIMGYDFTFSVSSGEEISVKIDSDSPYLFIYHARTETIEFYKASITEFQSVIAAAHQLEEKLLAITPDPEEYLPDPKGTVYLSYPWQRIQLSSPDALELITFLHEKLDGLPLVIRDKIIVDRYSVSSSNMSLYFDFDNNLITVDIIRSDYIDFYNFSIPKEDMTELFDRIQTLINQANPPVTPPETEKPVEPPTVLTFAEFLATKPDRISVYAQFGADQRYDAKDGTNNWFASLMKNLQECEFQACDPSINATNVGKPTIVLTKDGCSLYLLLCNETDSIITYLYDSAENLISTAHYKTDNALAFGRSISWANSSMLSGNLNVNETSALRKILSEEIKAASYRLYALQDALFSCQNAEEIQNILNCIKNMSFTEIPAVNLTCMGSVVTFTMKDGRTATISFDDTGYLHLLVKDAGGKTITSQWYEFFLKQYTTNILGCLSGIRRQYPVNVYPTPGNLYTELYPCASILNLYPEYLSSYTQPSDYEIGEIMRRIHELKLTELSETPDYVFNQPTLEFWFSNYVFKIIVDGENGYIRTFVEEFDQTTLLAAKMYKGSVQEIAALAAYLDKLIPDSPYVEETPIAPLDTFRTFLNQTIASLRLSWNTASPLCYEYTDAKTISAVLEKLKSLSLTNKQEAMVSGDSPNSSYVYITFANGNSMSLTFDTSGYVKYLLCDKKSGINYSGKYRLSAAEVKAFAEFIEPYLKSESSDEAPRIEDLANNAALQSFLAGVGVTVKGSSQDTPLEIRRILSNYNNTAKFFACELSYTSPDGIVLEYLLYDYAGIDRSPLTDEERLGLVKAGVHPSVLDWDCKRFTLEEIRGILEDNLAYMPAFADNLHEELLKCTVYLPETDCYYQFHTDSWGYIVGVNPCMYQTNRADTVIVLFEDYFYGGLQVAAFRIVDGEYKLYGYTPL